MNFVDVVCASNFSSLKKDSCDSDSIARHGSTLSQADDSATFIRKLRDINRGFKPRELRDCRYKCRF